MFEIMKCFAISFVSNLIDSTTQKNKTEHDPMRSLIFT